MRTTANIAAIMALTSTATAYFPFSSASDVDGGFEIPMKIQKATAGRTNGLGQHLQSMYSVNGYQPDYVDKQLLTFFDIQIYSKIYVGSQKQEFDMIFDTGSSWVWVGSDMCNNCANSKKFNFDKSSSFMQLTPYLSHLGYGKGHVWGYDSTDQVCLNHDSVIGNGCMEDYLFKLVVNQRDLEGLAGSGLIGLSPSSQNGGA
jgi:hypothetical protein